MKTKKIFLVLFLAASLTIANAQNFKLNDQIVNVGLGLGSTNYSSSLYSMRILPISFSYEKGIKDEIIEKGVFSVGGYLGMSSFKYNSNVSSVGNIPYTTDIIIGARGALHYPFLADPKLDTYLGLMIYYDIATWSTNNSSNPAIGGLSFSLYLGGRYYLDKNFSGFVELGYGISYLTIGVGYKL
jgi:hypothetical protein